MSFSVPSPYSPRRLTHIVPGTKRRIMTERAIPSFPDLFCSKCIKNNLIVEAHGFCKICADFLCTKCAKQHEETLMTLNHRLIVGDVFLERYRHAMRKDKHITSTMSSPRASKLSMVATGRASIDYIHPSENRPSVINSISTGVKRSSDLKVKVSTDWRKCFICACIVLADDNIILADANNKNLKMYNRHFTCLSVFPMKKEPWDLSTSIVDPSMFYVTEAHIKGVHQFEADCREIQYIMTIKTDVECYGIAALKDDCIAISVKHKETYEIRIIDIYGSILRKFTNSNSMFKIRSPWYLCSINKGRKIVISDVIACSITCIDVDGNVIFVVKNRNELNDPRSITSDKNDDIYVVDYDSDTVRQISPVGDDLGVILCAKDGLSNPCGLAVFDRLLLLQSHMDSDTMQTFLLT